MIFTFISQNESDREAPFICEIDLEADDLSSVIQGFEQFLRGSGFIFDGTLGINDDDLNDDQNSARFIVPD